MNSRTFYFALGRPFSPLYSLMMRLRERCYNAGLLATHRLPVPIISIGNLTMGGSGKTPVVQELARLLQSLGRHPAVISRGYGGTAQGKINLVSDGNRLLLDARSAGDEPRLLAETLPGVPVLTGIVRRLPAEEALRMGADVLLLDDAFQHLALARDVNLVLFNTDRLAGNSRVFPGGDLREPVVALKRASAFVLTGVREDNKERALRFAELLQSRFPETPTSLAGYEAATAVRLASSGLVEEAEDFDLLGDPQRLAPFFAFCGIAEPQSFLGTLERCGLRPAGFLPLSDHQHYSPALVRSLLHKAAAAGAHFLLTTEKDLVKLGLVAKEIAEEFAGKQALPLIALRMRVRLDPDFAEKLVAQVCAVQQP